MRSFTSGKLMGRETHHAGEDAVQISFCGSHCTMRKVSRVLYLLGNAMLAQLQKFEHKKPELVVEWNDSETEARGWLVINSLRGGAAGGGTRMRVGLDFQKVLLLAKTMEIGSTRGMGLTRISARSPEAVS